jgi:hypothetical protein
MKKIILTSILLSTILFSHQSQALPQNKAEYCERIVHENTIFDLSDLSENLMAFKNQGGVFNGGVCWWHSRFQRNIFYLGVLKPDAPKPSREEAKQIIKKIRAGKEVVTINGFQSFNDFTREFQKDIIKELENWQIYDGVVLGSWVLGVKGDTKIQSDKLSQMMNDLFQYVEVQNKIAYQKLQIKGITAHAWLVVGIKKATNGFEIGYIDSNNPMMSENYSFKHGDESFFVKGYGHFVPYTEFQREEERLKRVAIQYCSNQRMTQSQLAFQEKQDLNDYQRDLAEAKKRKN